MRALRCPFHIHVWFTDLYVHNYTLNRVYKVCNTQTKPSGDPKKYKGSISEEIAQIGPLSHIAAIQTDRTKSR